MIRENINERNNKILKIVMKRYIETGLPVGSEYVSKQYKCDISPATIRNTMADLEEQDYITQPHTSAGRIPTDKGYRYYVNKLLDTVSVEEDMKQLASEIFASPQEKDIDGLIDSISHFFSCAMGQVSLMLVSHSQQGKKERLFFRGIDRIIEQPEFRNNIDQIKTILHLLEEQDVFIDLFKKDMEQTNESVHLYIGSENPYEELDECTFLSAKCALSDYRGMLGILGPKRMDYEKIISQLQYFTQLCEQEEE